MRARSRGRGGVLLAAVLAACGLGSAGASAASAAPGYRLAFGSTVMTASDGGPLIIQGHRSIIDEPMMADQLVEYLSGSTTRPSMGQLVYEEYPGSVSHRHWHYKGFVRYQLRATSDLSLVRPDNKAGFCLSDPAYAPDFCGSMKPEALTVAEGLGRGTSDYYNPNLEGQWIDVADVPPGDYWLVHWVNAAKEICESDYKNNTAAVRIALWPNGYGVAPYFTVGEEREPFEPLYSDTGPPDDACVLDPNPSWGPPDLVQKKPTELALTPVGGEGPQVPPGSTPPGPSPTGSPGLSPTGSPRPSPTGSVPAVASAPTLRETLARRYVVRALTQRFHRRPRQVRQACRRVSRTSFLCRVRWHDRRYRYRGGVRIFTVRTRTGFERRFNLRVLRTDRRCARERRRGCSRTLEAKNVRFRSTATRSKR
jgi:Lysyl oxidase